MNYLHTKIIIGLLLSGLSILIVKFWTVLLLPTIVGLILPVISTLIILASSSLEEIKGDEDYTDDDNSIFPLFAVFIIFFFITIIIQFVTPKGWDVTIREYIFSLLNLELCL